MDNKPDKLIPKHGGYRNTKTWQLADLIYDITVLFCEKYVDKRSRTHDQMVQAARSGCQNLQEASVDSGTSKKIEIKLTGIAKGSLAELQRDYQKFLRHRGLPEWMPEHPALKRFRSLKCSTLEQFRAWVAQETKREKEEKQNNGEHGLTRTGEEHGLTRTDTDEEWGVPASVRVSPCASVFCCPSVSSSSPPLPAQLIPPPCPAFPAVCAANGTLSLLNLCIYLVGRQIDAQAETFEKEGGFTERLYRHRSESRTKRND